MLSVRKKIYRLASSGSSGVSVHSACFQNWMSEQLSALQRWILGSAQGNTPSTARPTRSFLMPHIGFLPRCCIHLLGVFNPLVWLFPHSTHSDQTQLWLLHLTKQRSDSMELSRTDPHINCSWWSLLPQSPASNRVSHCVHPGPPVLQAMFHSHTNKTLSLELLLNSDNWII